MITTRSLIRPSILAVMTMGLVLSAGPTVWAGAEEDTSGAEAARGARAWTENCARCHNFRDLGEFTDAQWDLIVTHMKVRANLALETAEEIEAFLKGSN